MMINSAICDFTAAPRRSALWRSSLLASVVLGLVSGQLAGCAIPGGTGAGASGGAADTPQATTLTELPAGDGPAAATALVETSYTIDGAILPVVRGQTRQSTRADMRRNDSLLTFDNWLLRRFAGDGRHADIVRVDRKLVWNLEPAKKQYTECPITGCPAPAGRPSEEQRARDPAQPREPDCPVTLKTNDLKVASSGERKTVNGFSSERFQITWTLELEDQNGRRNGNRVLLDMWTTAEVGAVKDVQAINDTYQRRYATAINAGDNPFNRYLPREVMTAMNALMKNYNTRTSPAWTNEFRKIRGYPMSMLMTWNSSGSVCSDSTQAAGGAGAMPSLGSLLGGLTGQKDTAAAGGAGASGAPLVSYAFEVKTLVVKPVSDNAFVPPADYQRKN